MKPVLVDGIRWGYAYAEGDSQVCDIIDEIEQAGFIVNKLDETDETIVIETVEYN